MVEKITDYSNKDNWLKIPKIKKDIDTIYFYPTTYIDPSEGAPAHSQIDTESMRALAHINYKKMGFAYEESTNVFAPYYRQENLAAVVGVPQDELGPFEEQISDLYGALDYYFAHYNEGRPFILAGHSQGSAMLRDVVLTGYFKEHADLLERMIATYMIGYSITKEHLAKNSHLKFAEQADDIGVIISWNTEGPGNKGQKNIVVVDGALCINPLNWKRDDTYASASENLGSVFFDENTGEYEIIEPGIADAKLDIERGVVITTQNSKKPMSLDGGAMDQLFGPDSYHAFDYGFYLRNLQENVRTRIAAYRKIHG